MRHPFLRAAAVVAASLALASIGTTIVVSLASSRAQAAPSLLVPVSLAPPAGLSVEPKEAPLGKGFEFKFKSDTSTTQLTLDPLGNRHNASGSISSKAGTISLTGKYSPSDRSITIVAKRAGQEIGEYSWRVEAVLR
ncbi:MAG: hypothetical protein LW806_08300 [Planctomycetaceae bacterium]|nr:hypothetical protein [Planctomycetaceae bacterium]